MSAPPRLQIQTILPPPSSVRPIETLFSKDGVFLFATAPSPSTSPSGDGDRDGVILTLTLCRDHEKNVMNPAMVSLLIQALDVIDSHPVATDTNNKALIITGMNLNENNAPASKFFSNGLDLEWFLRANSNASEDNPKPASKLIESFNSRVLARILTLPFRTVAAINGHCIGAGLFLALACDYRIMRTKRGYVQWPESRLGMRLTKGFAELSKAKIGNGIGMSSDHHVLREGVLTAKMFNSAEALSSGIIDAEYPIEELYSHAFRMAMKGLPESPSGMNLEYFDPKAYTEIKVEMYTDAYRALKFGKVEDFPSSRI
eukprot:CAMPEP_0172530252 /NCGR_PEP_ID=MMETSP1067-20121228/4041_1 /TAXON_ID=265564 ORGANISM="Thalassiosira punctigera, Strain Tpunct2005C2" /NCGR_SAMPLE_ID=MMETSP1067 /ASSEMBLY_ACC=CAM_ASM_000444 /LENGTH=315 /DNA_ID=CAMNT_0013314419 /DNA_START=221 /DNA_END=1168 /DNA_ORIENTATION=+